MERLTVSDLNKVCYDPWELCGMDSYCKKGCHEEGGCTKGCHILKMYRKLAEYEDLEEQGRLLKLPCKAGQKVYLLRKDIKSVIDGEITSFDIGEFAKDMRIFITDDNRYTNITNGIVAASCGRGSTIFRKKY